MRFILSLPSRFVPSLPCIPSKISLGRGFPSLFSSLLPWSLASSIIFNWHSYSSTLIIGTHSSVVSAGGRRLKHTLPWWWGGLKGIFWIFFFISTSLTWWKELKGITFRSRIDKVLIHHSIPFSLPFHHSGAVGFSLTSELKLSFF